MLLKGPLWHMPHLHMSFALFGKTYDLLQSLLNVAQEWFKSFLTKQCKNYEQNSYRRAPRHLRKRRVRGDRLVRLP